MSSVYVEAKNRCIWNKISKSYEIAISGDILSDNGEIWFADLWFNKKFSGPPLINRANTHKLVFTGGGPCDGDEYELRIEILKKGTKK